MPDVFFCSILHLLTFQDDLENLPSHAHEMELKATAELLRKKRQALGTSIIVLLLVR